MQRRGPWDDLRGAPLERRAARVRGVGEPLPEPARRERRTGHRVRAAHVQPQASGDSVEALRSCLGDLKGIDLETIKGRPGDERGQAESIKRCADGSRIKVEPRYVRMTQQEFDEARPAGPIRVICKDRVFLDRTSDYQPDRLNLVVEQDRIVWAGRF